jgi:hypothetical protein
VGQLLLSTLWRLSKPKRYHGTVTLDLAPVGHDAGKIAEELVQYLAGLVRANVEVTLEIQVDIPGGARRRCCGTRRT